MLGEYSGESNDAESQKDSELSVGNFGPVNAHEEPSHSTSESYVNRAGMLWQHRSSDVQRDLEGYLYWQMKCLFVS